VLGHGLYSLEIKLDRSGTYKSRGCCQESVFSGTRGPRGFAVAEGDGAKDLEMGTQLLLCVLGKLDSCERSRDLNDM
jgi:hypothetical protein